MSGFDEETVYEVTYRTRLMDTPSGWYMEGGTSQVIGVDGKPVPKVIAISIVAPAAGPPEILGQTSIHDHLIDDDG